MRRFATLGIIVALTIASMVSVYTPDAHAQSAGLVSSILNRMERNGRDLRSLRSGIVMEKYNSQIRDADYYVGNMIYQPGAKRNASVRIDWQKPQQEILSVVDGKYILFRPRLKQAYVGNANSNRDKVSSVLGFGLNVSGAQLKNRFEVSYLDERNLDGVATTHLKLVPKGNANYKYAEIWVDGTGMPVQTKVVERNDDSTTVRLTSPAKNARVDANEFKLTLPGDVKQIRG